MISIRGEGGVGTYTCQNLVFHAFTLDIENLIGLIFYLIIFIFRFKQQAMELSRRFHDRIVHPSQSVVYWTEYVINYKGAHHLMSGVTELYWFQAINLDVFALYLLIILVASYAMKKISSTFLNWARKLSIQGHTVFDSASNGSISEKNIQNGTHKNGQLKKSTHLKVN